jgi:hypothetical protein
MDEDDGKEPLLLDWLQWCSAAFAAIQRLRMITNYADRAKKAAEGAALLNRIGQ